MGRARCWFGGDTPAPARIFPFSSMCFSLNVAWKKLWGCSWFCSGITTQESHFPHEFWLLFPAATAPGGKSAFPPFQPKPRSLRRLQIPSIAELPCSHGFPEAGRLISFQEPESRWSEIPSKLPEPVRKGHYVSIAVLHWKWWLPAAPAPLFQAVPCSWRTSLVRAGRFWWRNKIPGFIPIFCVRQMWSGSVEEA